MKRFINASLLVTLWFAAVLPVQAGASHHGGHHGWRPPVREHHHHHHHHHHRHHDLAWGVAGLVLGSVIASTWPRTVVVSPPQVVASPPPRPPERYWYYCESYRAYYPKNLSWCPPNCLKVRQAGGFE